jgi:hypothetical protein
MAKKEKNVRNRARDMIGDYYKSNREVEKDNNARQENKKEWTRSEKLLLALIIIGAIGLVVKYVIL